ncbi:MAG: GNAT family N-acetyltransferase [Bacteroidia bacterium]|nr:GNAT family N-acetyltransferase [Bacteroidia bacterium]
MTTFKRSTPSDPAFQKLIIELDKDLWIRYPDIQQNFAPFNHVDDSFHIILAYEGDVAVGCGCFRAMKGKGTMEIKRMYVVPAFRNQGTGKMILQRLEEWAREVGFVQSKLETGINQPEAIAAYEKMGYIRIPNFAPYIDVAESICMMKLL